MSILSSAGNLDAAATLLHLVYPGAFALLPGIMNTPEARAQLLAIALQESRCTYRRQIGGPARGFWQFEKLGGVRGVLQHASAGPFAQHVCRELQYRSDADTCYTAIEHNDLLAVCFARLLLWTTPGLIAGRGMPDRGWAQYIEGWRPGKPHRETWNDFFAQAWSLVQP